MTMILKAKDIGMELQGKPLFEGIHLEVAEGERIALYGRNGMGKSTLLSILAGERQPTNGTVEAVLPRERWGWMRQQDEPDESEMTALEMVRSRSESSLWELKQQLAAIEKQMQATDADAMDRLVEQYGNLLERYESGGGFQWETEVEKAMTMLGIGPDVWPVPYKELSGGQKTKVMLGALLVRNPKFLLLDEPTNHLDSESLVWLEQWLVSSYKGTVLFVSHDREFIDRVATTVCELSATELRRYRGDTRITVGRKSVSCVSRKPSTANRSWPAKRWRNRFADMRNGSIKRTIRQGMEMSGLRLATIKLKRRRTFRDTMPRRRRSSGWKRSV